MRCKGTIIYPTRISKEYRKSDEKVIIVLIYGEWCT